MQQALSVLKDAEAQYLAELQLLSGRRRRFQLMTLAVLRHIALGPTTAWSGQRLSNLLLLLLLQLRMFLFPQFQIIGNRITAE